MSIGYLTHPDCAALIDPLCCAKRVKEIKTLFTRSEERVVGRSNDRVSKLNACNQAQPHSKRKWFFLTFAP